METKLRLISERAAREGGCLFNNLAHLLNEENLRTCFYALKRDRASGIDGVSFQEYERELDAHLKGLVQRMKRQAYKPQPVRRVYIRKANGKRRPLGIPTIEDKIVQMGIKRILEAIYENDFLDCSYGFRPGRSCHQAINRLDKIIMCNPVNHVIDADIKGFFDAVDHEWMVKFLGVRISDRNFIRLIVRFLKAGIMEEGQVVDSEKGTPQGGVLSPILANIYLHYVLDLWIEKRIKRNYEGYVEIVRYADDFILCVRYKHEAQQLVRMLGERLEKFGLELSDEKTRLIEFGRYAKDSANSRGKKPGSFEFLGFTHFSDHTRGGAFKVGRTTEKKRLAAKAKELNRWLKSVRNTCAVREWWGILGAKMEGHYRYFGVSGNYRSVVKFNCIAIGLVFKWFNRRSQKKSLNWEQFSSYLARYKLPRPKIHHNLYTLRCT